MKIFKIKCAEIVQLYRLTFWWVVIYIAIHQVKQMTLLQFHKPYHTKKTWKSLKPRKNVISQVEEEHTWDTLYGFSHTLFCMQNALLMLPNVDHKSICFHLCFLYYSLLCFPSDQFTTIIINPTDTIGN